MSKLSKKLFLSVITLVFTVMAMVATTYAWFTIGDTATVGNVEGSVQGSEGLEIQFDGDTSGEWYSNISKSKMDDFLGDAAEALKAISSPNGENFYLANEITYDGSNITFATGGGSGTANTHYVEFKLNFRTKAENKQVDLTKLDIINVADTTWAVDKGHNLANGDASSSTLTSSAAYAVRVALEAGSNVNVYELADNADLTTDGISNTKGFQVNGAHDYYIKKGNILLGFDESNYLNSTANLEAALEALKTKGYETIDSGVLGGVNRLNIELDDTADANGYYNGSVIVRIWIEGFDADAYNAIYEGKFAVNLEFTLEDK